MHDLELTRYQKYGLTGAVRLYELGNGYLDDAAQAIAKYIIRGLGAAIDKQSQQPPEFLLAVHEPNNPPVGTLF